MFVRKWLALRIMEGLTAHLSGELKIKAHLFAAAAFEYNGNACALLSVMCILTHIWSSKNIEDFK